MASAARRWAAGQSIHQPAARAGIRPSSMFSVTETEGTRLNSW